MKRLLAAACCLFLAACSTKAGTTTDATGTDGVRTGPGVTETEITLGVMTDLTGPFKNLATAITHGNELWAKDFNATGGACGRQVKITVSDHAYKADTAKALFPQMEPKVLGFVQLLGSPQIAALGGDLRSAGVTTTPTAWSSDLLNNPYVVVVGTTYDLEMINGLSYLREQGMIKAGDTIGHIYLDGDYGGNGLRGSRHYAEQHGLKIRDVKVTASDTDLTTVVTGLKGADVKAILLSTTPPQTGATAAAAKALGLSVPLLGNTPSYDPVLLTTPAAGALDELYVVASHVPYSADVPTAKEIAGKYKAAGFPEAPNAGVPYGHAVGQVWGAVLAKACANKDLTREGIQRALRQTTSADTSGLVPSLDFSRQGTPATRKAYVVKPDATTEGGLVVVKQLFQAEETKTYQAPHEQR